MLKTEKIERCEITKVYCPSCGKKVPRLGLKHNSTIKGLTIECRTCGQIFEVKTIE